MKVKQQVFLVIKLMLSIVIIYWLLGNVDTNNIIKLLGNMKLEFLFLALLVQVLHVVIATFRWHTILSYLEIKIPYIETLRFQWIGFFFNQAMPSSIGGDAFRIYYLYKNKYNLGNVTLSVLLDRVVGLIGLILLVIITLPVLLSAINGLVGIWSLIIFAVMFMGGIVIFFTMDQITVRFLHWKIIRLIHSLAKHGRRILLSIRPGILLIIMSFIIHSFSIVSMLILSHGMGLEIELTSLIAVVPLATLLATIPVSIAGWGVREGAMVVGLGYQGVSSEYALALSVMYGILMLFVSLPGALVWLKSGHPTDCQIDTVCQTEHSRI